MKRNFFIAILILSASFTASAQKGAAGKVTPANGVRAAFDRLVDGIKQVDADKVMSVYEKSDRLLIFNNNGSATGGWENVKSGSLITSLVTLQRSCPRHCRCRRR